MVRTYLGIGVLFLSLLAFIRGEGDVKYDGEKKEEVHVSSIAIKFADPQKGLEVPYANLLGAALKHRENVSFQDGTYMCQVEKLTLNLHNERKPVKDLLASKNSEMYVEAFGNFTKNIIRSLQAQGDIRSLNNLKIEIQNCFTNYLMKSKATLFGAYKSKGSSISTENLQQGGLGTNGNRRETVRDVKPFEVTTGNGQTYNRRVSCENSDSDELCKLREKYGISPITGNAQLQTMERIFAENTEVTLEGECYKSNDARQEKVVKFKGMIGAATISAYLKFIHCNNLRGTSRVTSEWSFTSSDSSLMGLDISTQSSYPFLDPNFGRLPPLIGENNNFNAFLSQLQSIFADIIRFRGSDDSQQVIAPPTYETLFGPEVNTISGYERTSSGSVMPELSTAEDIIDRIRRDVTSVFPCDESVFGKDCLDTSKENDMSASNSRQGGAEKTDDLKKETLMQSDEKRDSNSSSTNEHDGQGRVTFNIDSDNRSDNGKPTDRKSPRDNSKRIRAE